jgi:hypothetical protein
MPDGLTVRPVITAVLEHRTASSDCHAAKLDPGTGPGTYDCRECGQPCERVMSAPEEVTARG